MEIILVLIVVGLAIAAFIYGSIFFMIAIAYGYWGFSIGMAPVVWAIFIIGMIVGFVISCKNAVSAIKKVYGKAK